MLTTNFNEVGPLPLNSYIELTIIRHFSNNPVVTYGLDHSFIRQITTFRQPEIFFYITRLKLKT